MAAGEFALVKEHLEEASQSAVRTKGYAFDETEMYFMLADIAVQERDPVALEAYAPLAEETSQRDGHLLFQAAAHRARGVLQRLEGNYEEAKSRLTRALELFEGLETRWQIGRTLYELGDLARTRADPAEARDCFSRALASFEKIGAVPDAERAREGLRSLQ